MSNDTKHTPTPWKVAVVSGAAGGFDGRAYVNLRIEGRADTVEEVRALVDHAVNNHARLTRENEALRGALEDVLKMHARQGDGHRIYADYTCAMDRARAALARFLPDPGPLGPIGPQPSVNDVLDACARMIDLRFTKEIREAVPEWYDVRERIRKVTGK